MSQQGWKPVRLNEDKGKNKQESSSGQYLVDLVIHDEEVKKTFQGLIDEHPEFRVNGLKDSGISRLVILELDEDPAESFSFIESIVQGVDGREVFLTSPRTDSAVLLEALRAGVKEFFPQPLQKEEVTKALEKFVVRSQEANQGPTEKIGKVLCVLGGKGGVGTTTVAVNLAVSLKKSDPGQSVVLVEINQHAGDLPLFLDLQPAHSLRDIGADLSRLDIALLTKVLSKHESGIHVLPAGFDDLSSGRLTPECIEPTLKMLQSLYDYVVIDCGYVLDLTTKKAIELSSGILVVSSLLVPVVHRTKRILDLLRGSGYDNEKVKLILNRYSPEDNEVLRETEDALKCKASWVVPNDYPSASGAINHGTPVSLFVPKAPIAKCYNEVATSICQSPHAKKDAVPWVDRLRGIMVGRSKVKRAQAS